jgi:hypothetical protein
MESRKPLIIILINILIGVSWALVALGALIAFKHSQHLGLLTSIIFSFFGMIGGFTLVVIFEMCLLQYHKLQESKKQTKILEEIRDRVSNQESTKETPKIEIDSLSNN